LQVSKWDSGLNLDSIVNRSIPDVCATCHIHATCQQIEGKSVCICNYGFVGNGRTHCQDKDECQIGASKICGNHTLCHNTHGSFYCVCLDGYRASNNNKTFIPNDGTNCTDIDECEESGLCGHNARCVNTEGSYMCYCNDGYKLETGEQIFQPNFFAEIGCGSPPEMKHGYIVGNYSLLPGSAVHYECQEGFYSNEGKFSYCTANETWEPATLSCKGKYCHTRLLFKLLDEKIFSEDMIFNISTSEDNPKVCLDLNSGSNYMVNITTISSTNVTVSVTLAIQTKVKEAFNNVLIFNDTCLKWRRNVRGTDVEDRYSFHVQGQRWYQKNFFHEMTFELSTHKQAPEVCLDLQPGTNYSINISMVALNFSLLVSMTTQITDPPFPKVEFVAVKGSAPLLRLRKAEDQNGPISFYQVIVLPLDLQSTFICDSFAATTFFSNTTDIKGYVAAEFRAKDVADNMSITLGDRHYYGKFYNAPLKLGEEYCVFLKIISEWNKVMDVLKPLYTS
uniref:Sushi domain containing 1 n=1 Tax=Catharus ustulatus TaxID=91951 RepID=A0A8C3UWG9_CATUS